MMRLGIWCLLTVFLVMYTLSNQSFSQIHLGSEIKRILANKHLPRHKEPSNEEKRSPTPSVPYRRTTQEGSSSRENYLQTHSVSQEHSHDSSSPPSPATHAVSVRLAPHWLGRQISSSLTAALKSNATLGLGSGPRRLKRSRGPAGSRGPVPGMGYASERLRWRLLPEGLSNHIPVWKQRQAISLALRQWAEVVPLSFWEDQNSPSNEIDIRIGFGTGRHLGCPLLFDGAGGELAHTVQPGEIHLDDDEAFAIEPFNYGVSLLKVMIHEAGHVLGLPHLASPDSVMHPLYSITGGAVELSTEDRTAIQGLYGQCEGSFDTVFDWVREVPNVHQGEPALYYNTYFFRDDQYWLYDNQRGRPRRGYPRSLQQGWRGLPKGRVDAYLHVLTSDQNRVYFFKGTRYWLCDGIRQVFQDPEGKPISQGFPGIYGPIDTAAFSRQNHLIYFFRGHQVWGFDVTSQQVAKGFPRSLVNFFPELEPNDHPHGNLDAAYYSYTHHALFLIKGLNFWEVSKGGNGEHVRANVLLPHRRVADQWKDLCNAHSSIQES